MRLGINPEKIDREITITNYHRIIIPVYIPHFDDYFKDSLQVFKLCIESLLLTVHSKTRITIYNNNSHLDVKNLIDELYDNNEFIDQVFHSKENVGKINAILAAAKGNLEPLITISDADVLFKNGWQKEVEKIFLNFPEAGMVSPVPSSKAMIGYTANNWSYALFKGKLKFQNVIDSEAMHKFDLSLGNKELMYKKVHLENYLVLNNKKNKAEAVMGCGHFVATLKRDVFDKGCNQPAFIKIVGGVENKFIDLPNEKLGYLRLATRGNYAYHMGNFSEDWMFEEFKNLNKESYLGLEKPSFENKKMNSLSTILGKVFVKLMKKPRIRFVILKRFGLKNVKEYTL